MIKFEIQARSGSTNASTQAAKVCQTLSDELFPLEFEMICKSTKNNYQL